jgi:hypothetical protein
MKNELRSYTDIVSFASLKLGGGYEVLGARISQPCPPSTAHPPSSPPSADPSSGASTVLWTPEVTTAPAADTGREESLQFYCR